MWIKPKSREVRGSGTIGSHTPNQRAVYMATKKNVPHDMRWVVAAEVVVVVVVGGGMDGWMGGGGGGCAGGKSQNQAQVQNTQLPRDVINEHLERQQPGDAKVGHSIAGGGPMSMEVYREHI